jgi:hypothetical protein
MSFSFFFIALIFNKTGRLESSIKWIFISAFVLTIVSLIMISIQYGLDRKDRFEIVSLSIAWLVLIVNGILLSIYFKKEISG